MVEKISNRHENLEGNLLHLVKTIRKFSLINTIFIKAVSYFNSESIEKILTLLSKKYRDENSRHEFLKNFLRKETFSWHFQKIFYGVEQ